MEGGKESKHSFIVENSLVWQPQGVPDSLVHSKKYKFPSSSLIPEIMIATNHYLEVLKCWSMCTLKLKHAIREQFSKTAASYCPILIHSWSFPLSLDGLLEK